jgi:hypothetical protein
MIQKIPKDIMSNYVLSYLGSYSGILLYVDKNTKESVKNKVNKLEIKDFVYSSELIKWARENGCPWNEDTYSSAAKNGHLEVLKWLRDTL